MFYSALRPKLHYAFMHMVQHYASTTLKQLCLLMVQLKNSAFSHQPHSNAQWPWQVALSLMILYTSTPVGMHGVVAWVQPVQELLLSAQKRLAESQAQTQQAQDKPVATAMLQRSSLNGTPAFAACRTMSADACCCCQPCQDCFLTHTCRFLQSTQVHI